MKVIIETEEKKGLKLADLKDGDACKLKREVQQTPFDAFAIVTDLEPPSLNCRMLLDIANGEIFRQSSDTPVERLENAEFHPYGTGFNK